MTNFPGTFEVLAADQHDARLASRKALVLSRDRIDARLGKFFGASGNPVDFAARYQLVAEDFAGIVRVAANEVGHEDPDSLIKTLHAHYRQASDEKWIQNAVKKPGDLHKKLHVPEDENIPEEKIENAEKSGDKNLKEKAQFAENVKKSATVSDYLSSYYSSDDDKDDKDDKKDNKPPWLEDDNDDKDDHDEHKHDEDDTDDDGEDDFKSSSTSGAVPLVRKQAERYFVCAKCGHQQNHPSGVEDPDECENCGNRSLTEHDSPEEQDDMSAKRNASVRTADEDDEPIRTCSECGTDLTKNESGRCAICAKKDREHESFVHVADKGNTGLGGPSPKMNKQRWTPKSVPKDEYDGGKDGIGDHKEMDILEVLPKKNLTGPAKDVSETGKAKEEKLPTAKGMDDAGFEPSKNTGDSGPTKTFPKGNQTNPVTKKPVEE